MLKRGYCPHCRRHLLSPVAEGSTELDACVHCGGLWFDHGELARVIDTSVGEPVRPADLGQPGASTSMRCPACEDFLVAYTFAELGGVELDVCEHCEGVWLERGELPRLQVARAHEILDKERTWRNWLFQFVSHLPVEFNVRPRRFPLVSAGIIAINVALTLFLLANGELASVVTRWGLVPREAFSQHWLITTISYSFLHGGVLHLLFNMYFLYILGDNVEDVLGRFGFSAFYLLLAALAGVTHTLLAPGDPTPMVGASGAISGVLGAYAVFFRHARLTFMLLFWQFKLRAPIYIAIWASMNVAGLLLGTSHIAWDAHLGGFAAGLLAAFALDRTVVSAHPFLPLLRQSARR